MIIYVENATEFPKEILELIKEFNKAIRYTINIQTSIIFLCTINEQSEIEIKNNIIYNSGKNKNCLGIYLTKICKAYTLKTTKYC